MGRFGYHVVDADGHVFETPTLYQRFCDTYLDAKHRPTFRDMLDEAQRRGAGTPIWSVRSKVPILRLDRQLGVVEQKELPPRKGGKDTTKESQERWDPQGRLEDMDLEGIDVAVIFPSGLSSFCALDDMDLEVGIYRAYHRAMSEYCKANSQRLKYVALVGMRDVVAGVAELKRAAQDPNVVGACISAHMGEKLLDHPDFHPIWEASQDLGLAVVIHGQGNGRPPYGLGNWEGAENLFIIHSATHPYEQMRAMAALLGGGVLQRFPSLRFTFLESGCGWVPFWLDRLEEHWEMMRGHVPLLTRSPRELVRGGDQCFISCDPDETTIESVVQLLGQDRVIYASDYPHFDGRFPDSVRLIAERTALPDSAKRKILGENSLRLYPRLQVA